MESSIFSLGSLVIFLGFGLSFSGCFSSPGNPLESSVSSPIRPLPPNADLKKGAVEGNVLGDLGETLAGVRLLLLTEPRLQTESNASGYFLFVNVTDGRYVLRAEAMDYKASETSVNITRGETTLVELILEPIDSAHRHDYWFKEGKPVTRRAVFDGPVEFPWSLTQGGEQDANVCAWGVPSRNTGPSCDIVPVVPDGVGPWDGIVWPGTESLEVSVDWWTPPPPIEMRVRFVYAPANNSSYGHSFDMQPGTTYTINVPPWSTDTGHQEFSLWDFHLEVKFADYDNNGDVIRSVIGPFQVRIIAVKGVITLDPPHPKYWENGNSQVVLDLKHFPIDAHYRREPKTRISYYPETDGGPGAIYFFPPVGNIVPPGTTRLLVTLDYHFTHTDLNGTLTIPQKTLSFRTPATTPGKATFQDLKKPPHQDSPGRTSWIYELTSPQGGRSETDQHYLKSSGWMFMLANAGNEDDKRFVNEGPGQITYRLVVVNDHWDPEP